MLVGALVRMVIGAVVGRWLLRRLVMVVVSVVAVTLALLVLGSLMAGPAFSAEPEVETSDASGMRVEVLGTLAPEIAPQPSAVARSDFYRSTTMATIPVDWPVGTRIVLSGRPDGTGQVEVDDAAVVTIRRADGGEQRIELGFQRSDGDGVQGWGPVDVTDLLGRGQVGIQLSLIDLYPPTSWSSAFYLVAVRPRAEAEPGGHEEPPEAGGPPPGFESPELVTSLWTAVRAWWPVVIGVPVVLIVAGFVRASAQRGMAAAIDEGMRAGAGLESGKP